MDIFSNTYNGVPVDELYSLHAELQPSNDSITDSEHNFSQNSNSIHIQLPVFDIKDLKDNLVDARDFSTNNSNLESTFEEQFSTDKSHKNISQVLKSLMSQNNCLICFEETYRGHYKNKKHIRSVLEWINSNAKTFRFNLSQIDNLFCKVCHNVFSNNIESSRHYKSLGHEMKLEYQSQKTNTISDVKILDGPIIQKNSENKEIILRMKILEQLQVIVDKLYVSREIPFDIGLKKMKDLNQKISNIQYSQ
ncbi:hypothetical protein ABEB36_002051 [Hypothenemus hampei]|uniref:C2H2-type domain-containing protein n=1 Tax=Hypothenemus hampei TaxID=57062 RepID=A0ABD1F5Z2_HYPHA